MDRRQFLLSVPGWLSVAALMDTLPRLAWAADQPAPCFLLINTFGGMDATLGLDPQVRPDGVDEAELFLEYRPDEIVQAAGLRLGPAAAALVPHAADCTVVNGIMMRRDAGHGPANLYMQTGRGDGAAATLPVEIAVGTVPAPFGVAMNQSVYLANRSMLLAQLNDLKDDSENGELLLVLEEKIAALGAGAGPFGEAQKALLAAKEPAQRLSTILADMKKQFGNLTDPHVIAAAFAAGAVRQAQWDMPMTGILDTHNDHAKNHLRLQTEIWNNVAACFQLFKRVPYGAGSLFDATTFFVMSEFSRTPYLNAAKGKDHNPFTNSLLLAGRGARGGRTVGRSRFIPKKSSKTNAPEHFAAPIDYKTGQPAAGPAGASFIYPENLVQTLLTKFYGVPASKSPVGPDVPSLPNLG